MCFSSLHYIHLIRGFKVWLIWMSLLAKKINPYQLAHLINKRDGRCALNYSNQASEKKVAQGFRAQHDFVNDSVNDLDSQVEIQLVPGWYKKDFSDHTLMYSTYICSQNLDQMPSKCQHIIQNCTTLMLTDLMNVNLYKDGWDVPEVHYRAIFNPNTADSDKAFIKWLNSEGWN